MKRLGIILGLFVCLVAVRAAAQATHQDTKPTKLAVLEPLAVGAHTLNTGEYNFECRTIDGQHFLIVTAVRDGAEIARVPCTPVSLPQKVDASQYRTKTADGKNVLTELRVKGETIAHAVVVN